MVVITLVLVEQHSIEKPSTEVENLGGELKVKTRTVNKGEFQMIKSHCLEIVSHLRIEGMHQHLIYRHYQLFVLHKENRGTGHQIID